MKKRCRICLQIKDISFFYERKNCLSNPYRNECKKCSNLNMIRHRKESEPYRIKSRIWASNYMKTRRKEKGFSTRASNIYRKENPEKVRAHEKIRSAMKNGTIKRQPCEICGKIKFIHAHHPDYSKPLDVKWLCPIHHMQIHYNILPKELNTPR